MTLISSIILFQSYLLFRFQFEEWFYYFNFFWNQLSFLIGLWIFFHYCWPYRISNSGKNMLLHLDLKINVLMYCFHVEITVGSVISNTDTNTFCEDFLVFGRGVSFFPRGESSLATSYWMTYDHMYCFCQGTKYYIFNYCELMTHWFLMKLFINAAKL